MSDNPAGAPNAGTAALLEEARRSVRATADALAGLAEQLGDEFVQALTLVLECRGHVIVAGAGTSSTMAGRLAHLLTVCGAPAFSLSPSDASHGGAGTITSDDVVIAISKGGESDELNSLVTVARMQGVQVIAMTQNRAGTLARASSHVLAYQVPEEVDAEGYIALGSSLATGAVGDALCFAVFQARGFDPDRLARIHPGGAVGKALGGRPA